jgi:hypothetical protein
MPRFRGRVEPRWKAPKHPPTRRYPKPTTPYGGLLVFTKDGPVRIVREACGCQTRGRPFEALQGEYWVMPPQGGRMTVKYLSQSEMRVAVERARNVSK